MQRWLRKLVTFLGVMVTVMTRGIWQPAEYNLSFAILFPAYIVALVTLGVEV